MRLMIFIFSVPALAGSRPARQENAPGPDGKDNGQGTR